MVQELCEFGSREIYKSYPEKVFNPSLPGRGTESNRTEFRRHWWRP